MDIRSTVQLGKSPKDTEMMFRILNRSGMTCCLISCPIRALCPYVWLVFNFWLKSCVCLRDQPRIQSAAEATSAQVSVVSLPGD